MSLKDKIETEYKNALKSKDKIKISTYRLILSSIKDVDILFLSLDFRAFLYSFSIVCFNDIIF